MNVLVIIVPWVSDTVPLHEPPLNCNTYRASYLDNKQRLAAIFALFCLILNLIFFLNWLKKTLRQMKKIIVELDESILS